MSAQIHLGIITLITLLCFSLSSNAVACCWVSLKSEKLFEKLFIFKAWTSHSALINSLRLLALPFLATLSFRACCSLKWSSSALRSRPGHAHIRPSNDRRPNTWPLTGNRCEGEKRWFIIFYSLQNIHDFLWESYHRNSWFLSVTIFNTGITIFRSPFILPRI